MQAMKDWHKSHPHLFVKSPRNHAGRDKYPFVAFCLFPLCRTRRPGLLAVPAPRWGRMPWKFVFGILFF